MGFEITYGFQRQTWLLTPALAGNRQNMKMSKVNGVHLYSIEVVKSIETLQMVVDGKVMSGKILCQAFKAKD